MSRVRDRAREALETAFWRCGVCEDHIRPCEQHGLLRDLADENDRLERALAKLLDWDDLGIPVEEAVREARAALSSGREGGEE